MNTESDTPRTDAARIEMIYDMIYHDNDPYFGLIARADKMEELERETNELRELLKQSLEYLEDCTDEGSLNSGWKSKELLALISKIEEKTK